MLLLCEDDAVTEQMNRLWQGRSSVGLGVRRAGIVSFLPLLYLSNSAFPRIKKRTSTPTISTTASATIFCQDLCPAAFLSPTPAWIISHGGKSGRYRRFRWAFPRSAAAPYQRRPTIYRKRRHSAQFDVSDRRSLDEVGAVAHGNGLYPQFLYRLLSCRTHRRPVHVPVQEWADSELLPPQRSHYPTGISGGLCFAGNQSTGAGSAEAAASGNSQRKRPCQNRNLSA